MSSPSSAQVGAPLNDFADQFTCLLNEKRDLTFRLTKALAENAKLSQLHQQACAQLDGERNRLTKSQNAGPASLQSLLAAKEKLIREEFERKFQELTVAVRQERTKYKTAVDEMKKQMAGCICQVKKG